MVLSITHSTHYLWLPKIELPQYLSADLTTQKQNTQIIVHETLNDCLLSHLSD